MFPRGYWSDPNNFPGYFGVSPKRPKNATLFGASLDSFREGTESPRNCRITREMYLLWGHFFLLLRINFRKPPSHLVCTRRVVPVNRKFLTNPVFVISPKKKKTLLWRHTRRCLLQKSNADESSRQSLLRYQITAACHAFISCTLMASKRTTP